MKKFLTTLFTLYCLSLLGNLVYNQPFEHTQPDGKVLSLLVSGDEYYHRVHDADGYTILLHPETGYAVYAIPDGNSIKASDHMVGTVSPASLGIQPNLFRDPAIAESRWREQLDNMRNTRTDPTGTIDNVVCFVRFNDQTEFPTSPTYAWYNNLFNSTSQQSLADFYDEVSSGQLDINTFLYSSSGGYVLSIQVSHNRGYYSPYNATTNPEGYQTEAQKNSRHQALIGELCGLADPLVPAGVNMDRDGDGKNDALTFVIRGATDNWGDLLWPAHWTWTGSVGTINGVEVWHYIFDFEGGLGASVVCHEMGHNIGFPDLYHYSHDGLTPVGQWSLMATDNCQHELVYEKLKYGTWFASIPTITPTSTPTQYSLTAIDQSPYSAYKIASTYANQFYVLEYRRDTGRYEAGIPASGLIVYRVIDYYPLVGGSDIDGNADGPPDELYVYRPGGDIDTNGTIANANFSSTVSRTAIHNFTDPEPWIFVNSTTQVDGNLVITDIGASGGTTITFTVRNAAPFIWDGSSSTAWNTATNWNQNAVPGSGDYVEIPAGMPRYPVVSTIQYCKNVIVKSGASLTVNDGSLYVSLDVDNYGSLIMNHADAVLFISRDLFFRSGSSANISADGIIYVQGDLEFHQGITLANGTLQFFGTGNSYVRTYAASTINDYTSNKDDTYFVSISNLSTATTTINGYWRVYEGSTSHHAYAGTTIVKDNIYVYTGGNFYCNSGTISFEGSSTSYVYTQSGNYFNNFTVNKTGVSVVLNSNVDINGTVTIQSGTFYASSYTVNVGGNWNNTAGPTAFNEGTSRVIFDNASTHQYCYYPETFNVLEVNCVAALRVQCTAPTDVVSCAQYDWTAGAIDVIEGTFTANDLADNAIQGGWFCNTGGTINIYNPAPDEYIDLKGDLYIYGGNVNVYGGSIDSYWPYMEDALIYMSGGTLDFKDRGVYLSASYNLNETITGGTIKVARGFTGVRTDFNPTGGRIEFTGDYDSSISMEAGSNFYNVHIHKQTAREEGSTAQYETDRFGQRIPLTRANTITASSNLDINGYFWIETGTFNAGSYTMNVALNWYSYVGEAGFLEGNSTVIFDGNDDSDIYVSENFNKLELNKGGTGCLGIPGGYIVTCNSYDWTAGKLYVYGGTFTANDLVDTAILGTIELTSGLINYHQGTTSGQYVDLQADVTISGGEFHVYGGIGPSYWPNGGPASLTMSGSGIFDFHNISIYVYNTNTFTDNLTGGTIRVGYYFYCNRPDFTPGGGTLEMYSSLDAGLYMYQGSLNNLKINKSARDGETRAAEITPATIRDRFGQESTLTRANTVTAGYDYNLDINGYFQIYAGTFVAPDTMYVGSYWHNWVGPAAFTEGSGLVVFDGSSNVYVYPEEFNRLELNKPGEYYIYIGTGTVQCNSYNWTSGKLKVEGGTFTALDMYDTFIGGYIELVSGYINFYQDSNWLDLRAVVSITGGEWHIYGMVGIWYWPFGGNASLTMSSGLIDVHDQGILVYSTGYTFTSNITGGLIKTAGQFYCARSDFNPTGGTVEMYSTADVDINVTAGTLYNLTINKGARGETEEPVSREPQFWRDRDGEHALTRSNTVTVSASFTCTNTLTIESGSFDLNGHTVTALNDLLIYGSLIMINAADHIIAGDNITWHTGSSSNVTQGAITGGGNWWVYSGTTVQLPASVTTNLRSIYTTDNIYNADPDFHFGTLVIDGAGTGSIYTINASSSYPLWITGDLSIGTNYELDVTDQSVTVNGNLNLDGKLDIHETYVTLDGKPYFESTSNLTIDSGAMNFYDDSVPRTTYLYGTVNINTGTLQAENNSLTIQSGSVNTLVSGTIICDGINATSAGTFQPAGGTVEITSNPASGTYMLSVTNGNWLPELVINTSTGVSLNADLTVKGNIIVTDGKLDLNGHVLGCEGDINVYDRLEVDAGATLAMLVHNKSLNIKSGGRLNALGNSTSTAFFYNPPGYSNYNIESGGTVAASYATFQWPTAAGVNVQAGATVDTSYPFSNCTFKWGVSGGTLLTLNNNQNLAIYDAIFTAGGTESSNVSKTSNIGMVNFVNATGTYAGEPYDNDVYDRVWWTANAAPATPDVQILKAVYSDPNPDLGETVTCVVTYVNASTTATGTCRLDLYWNRTTPPGLYQYGDQAVSFGSIPAGIPQLYSFNLTNNDPGNAGTWNSYLQIDAGGNVAESNETNNVYGPFSITWNLVALPAIDDLTIEFVSPNQVRLDWTYPVVCDRFNIYRSTDPHFTPGPGNLISSVTYPTTEYMETAAGNYYFYIVKAEIDPAARSTDTFPAKQELPPNRIK